MGERVTVTASLLLLALLTAPASSSRLLRATAAPSTAAVRRALLSPPPSFAATAAALDATLELDDAKARVQREACAAVLRAFGVTRSNGGDGAAPPMEPPAADGLAKGGTASRATVVLPSGAGKTVCALRVAEALRSQLTLVLVPSIELVSQTYREWERWREHGALDGWRPLAVVSSSSEPTLPRTTKVDEIVSYLRASQGRPQVIFCTYHSARRVAEALDGEQKAVDLLVSCGALIHCPLCMTLAPRSRASLPPCADLRRGAPLRRPKHEARRAAALRWLPARLSPPVPDGDPKAPRRKARQGGRAVGDGLDGRPSAVWARARC